MMTSLTANPTFLDTNILIYASIVQASMQTYGIGHLLTHNTADFNRFSGLITVLPLIQL